MENKNITFQPIGHPDGISMKEKNLCVRAWELFARETILPPVEIHLHKQIPVGAGLGGGSSNASKTLNRLEYARRESCFKRETT